MIASWESSVRFLRICTELSYCIVKWLDAVDVVAQPCHVHQNLAKLPTLVKHVKGLRNGQGARGSMCRIGGKWE